MHCVLLIHPPGECRVLNLHLMVFLDSGLRRNDCGFDDGAQKAM